MEGKTGAEKSGNLRIGFSSTGELGTRKVEQPKNLKNGEFSTWEIAQLKTQGAGRLYTKNGHSFFFPFFHFASEW